MTDITTRPATRPFVDDADTFPEPHVELAPLGERAAIWIIAAVGPWIGIAWAVKVFLL